MGEAAQHFEDAASERRRSRKYHEWPRRMDVSLALCALRPGSPAVPMDREWGLRPSSAGDAGLRNPSEMDGRACACRLLRPLCIVPARLLHSTTALLDSRSRPANWRRTHAQEPIEIRAASLRDTRLGQGRRTYPASVPRKKILTGTVQFPGCWAGRLEAARV
ncbi:hypothetical protein NA57DRAFT_55542 [Rhizodiscina lignyota]|uniref:Uncharacterized protein n=1 Tax=Rhizodiscina lignyota TaxID=1504668 RepID=A0A9P4IHW4_9PEZI|nr:hypothetical protein NA57DRAFT_55542 [Rhizodiscina lignyota]